MLESAIFRVIKVVLVLQSLRPALLVQGISKTPYVSIRVVALLTFLNEMVWWPPTKNWNQ